MHRNTWEVLGSGEDQRQEDAHAAAAYTSTIGLEPMNPLTTCRSCVYTCYSLVSEDSSANFMENTVLAGYFTKYVTHMGMCTAIHGKC